MRKIAMTWYPRPVDDDASDYADVGCVPEMSLLHPSDDPKGLSGKTWVLRIETPNNGTWEQPVSEYVANAMIARHRTNPLWDHNTPLDAAKRLNESQ